MLIMTIRASYYVRVYGEWWYLIIPVTAQHIIERIYLSDVITNAHITNPTTEITLFFVILVNFSIIPISTDLTFRLKKHWYSLVPSPNVNLIYVGNVKYIFTVHPFLKNKKSKKLTRFWLVKFQKVSLFLRNFWTLEPLFSIKENMVICQKSHLRNFLGHLTQCSNLLKKLLA